MLTDKWLKGFQNILNYARDMGCQSCVTNFGTPCSNPSDFVLCYNAGAVSGADRAGHHVLLPVGQGKLY